MQMERFWYLLDASVTQMLDQAVGTAECPADLNRDLTRIMNIPVDSDPVRSNDELRQKLDRHRRHLRNEIAYRLPPCMATTPKVIDSALLFKQ